MKTHTIQYVKASAVLRKIEKEFNKFVEVNCFSTGDSSHKIICADEFLERLVELKLLNKKDADNVGTWFSEDSMIDLEN